MIGCEANLWSITEKDLSALKVIFLGSSTFLTKLAPGALLRRVVQGQASRAKLTLGYFPASCVRVERGVTLQLEAKLRGEAIIRPASLGERGYALTKVAFLP